MMPIIPPAARCPSCGRSYAEEFVTDAPSVNTIIAECATAWKVTPAAVLSNSREAAVVRARHLAMWIIRECFTPRPTLQSIAKLFSRKDHGTVTHALTALDALPSDSRQKRLFLAMKASYRTIQTLSQI